MINSSSCHCDLRTLNALPLAGDEFLAEPLTPAGPAVAEDQGVVLPFAEIQDDTEMWPSRAGADCRWLLPGPATGPGPAGSPRPRWLFRRQEQMSLPSEPQSVMTTWGAWLSYSSHTGQEQHAGGATCEHLPGKRF